MSEVSSDHFRTPRPVILVVDDFEDTRKVLRLWLERQGYGVVEASDGFGAIEAARSEAPALVIMDIEMPGLDGLEATRRIRAREDLRDLPVIAVSAYGAEQFRARALDAGCDEYVSTPFDPEELKRLIELLIQA